MANLEIIRRYIEYIRLELRNGHVLTRDQEDTALRYLLDFESIVNALYTENK